MPVEQKKKTDNITGMVQKKQEIEWKRKAGNKSKQSIYRFGSFFFFLPCQVFFVILFGSNRLALLCSCGCDVARPAEMDVHVCLFNERSRE